MSITDDPNFDNPNDKSIVAKITDSKLPWNGEISGNNNKTGDKNVQGDEKWTVDDKGRQISNPKRYSAFQNANIPESIDSEAKNRMNIFSGKLSHSLLTDNQNRYIL